MFTTQAGEMRVDAEVVFERIKRLPDEEIAAIDQRRQVLRDALGSFDARLKELPTRERKATLALLYKEITDTVFDFHLSLETSATREQIAVAQTREEKLGALQRFRAVADDLAALYDIR